MNKIKTITAIVILITGFCAISHITTHYSKEATVSIVHGSDVTFTDEHGEDWYFEDCAEPLQVGDSVRLKMWNALTDSDPFDDVIVKIEKVEK